MPLNPPTYFPIYSTLYTKLNGVWCYMALQHISELSEALYTECCRFVYSHAINVRPQMVGHIGWQAIDGRPQMLGHRWYAIDVRPYMLGHRWQAIDGRPQMLGHRWQAIDGRPHGVVDHMGWQAIDVRPQMVGHRCQAIDGRPQMVGHIWQAIDVRPQMLGHIGWQPIDVSHRWQAIDVKPYWVVGHRWQAIDVRPQMVGHQQMFNPTHHLNNKSLVSTYGFGTIFTIPSFLGEKNNVCFIALQ